MKSKKFKNIFSSIAVALSVVVGISSPVVQVPVQAQADLSQIPWYTGSPYTIINDNIPEFSEEDMTTDAFETYSELDELGRCGVAYANIGKEIMPTEKRGKIGHIKPSGWHTVKYPDIIDDGLYLYNRCHLIGYQLSGENDNEKNLITGTRYLNVEGMLPFENQVDDYIEETGNHVLYRVTPLYDGNNLVCHGIQMEAKSVEDDGAGIEFNVFCYNNQPGITIDYSTGESCEGSLDVSGAEVAPAAENAQTYVLNTNTKKIHLPDCMSVSKMKPKNKKEVTDSLSNLINSGCEPCKMCIG